MAGVKASRWVRSREQGGWGGCKQCFRPVKLPGRWLSGEQAVRCEPGPNPLGCSREKVLLLALDRWPWLLTREDSDGDLLALVTTSLHLS